MSENGLEQAEADWQRYDNEELIFHFYDTDCDEEVGRELATRLYRHAELEINPNETPLPDRNGNQVVDNGKPLHLVDYVNYAARHHFASIDSILDFLLCSPADPEYGPMKDQIIDRSQISSNG